MFENIFTGHHFIKQSQSITEVKEITIARNRKMQRIGKYDERVRKSESIQ